MPQINPSVPTTKREFLGISFDVPGAFAPGDTLDETTAKWANFMVGSVVGNSYAGDVRRELAKLNAERAAAFKAKTYDGPLDEKGKPAAATPADLSTDHASAFAEKYANFKLGVSNRSSAAPKGADPTATLAHTLATLAVKALIIKSGRKVKDFMDAKVTVDGEEVSKFSALVADYKAAHPELIDQARAQLGDIAGSDGDTGGLDLTL